MATRRARIKAVASLPVRRKNVEVKDDQKLVNKVLNSEDSKETELNSSILTKEVINDRDVLKSPVPIEKVPDNTTPILIQKDVSTTDKTHSPNQKIENLEKSTPSLHNEVDIPKKRHRSIIELESDNKSHNQIQEQTVFDSNISEKKNVADNIVVDGISKIATKSNESTVINLIDGIVPLQTIPKSKPLHLLTSDLISENAEVVFDPIVPLPSLNKVRQKLKPVPRFNPPRRNSVQGSASESEDESRRSLLGRSQTPKRTRHDSQTSYSTVSSLPNRELSRVRNDSICSLVSHSTVQNAPLSPKLSKSKRPENQRRINAMKRRQQLLDGGTKDGLTMYDLIFYNPTTNPIISDKEDEGEEIQEIPIKKKEEDISKEKSESIDIPKDEEDSTPAPQIKIGPDGKIVLDEKSLVIEGTESKRGWSSSIVRERGAVRGGRYSRTPRTADWSAPDTVRFYRALAAVGTDFSMMATLFPNRTRREIKIKFKKEERLNGAQVDRALQSCVPWEVMALEAEFQQQREREAAAKRADTKGIRKARARILKDAGVAVISHGGSAVDVFRSRTQLGDKTPQLDDILSKTKETANKSKTKIYTTMSAKKLHTPKPAVETRTPETYPAVALTKNKIRSEIINKSRVPADIENGSLVVLAVNDPNAPGKKILQTYISDEKGKLTTVNLPTNLLSSVAGYIKKGSPRNTTSPASIGLATLTPSPSRRQRHDSYTITTL